MDSTPESAAFYYYSLITITAAALCMALVGFLKWPLLAEIPLAICIFIQIIALSKGIYNNGEQYNNKVMISEFLSRTKADLFSLETQEEEANI